MMPGPPAESGPAREGRRRRSGMQVYRPDHRSDEEKVSRMREGENAIRLVVTVSPVRKCGGSRPDSSGPCTSPSGGSHRRTWEWEHTSFCLTFRLRCLSECRGDSNVLLAYATSHWALAIGFSPPHLNKKIERRHGPVAGTRTDD